MNETVQILQDLARNAQSGLDAIEALTLRAESRAMRDALNEARTRYQKSLRDGERALRAAGGPAEPTGKAARTAMKLGLELQTAVNRTDDHIAEMVIQGATMGVIEMTKSMNTYAEAEPYARSLASQFIVQQNEIIETHKKFLENLVHA